MRRWFVLSGILILLLGMFMPVYLNARFGHRENLVKNKLRTLYEANELFRKTHQPAEYPQSMTALKDTRPPLVDAWITEQIEKGYEFIYDRTNGDRFSILAKPIYKYLTGHHTFFIDETGIIRINSAAGDPIDA